MRANNLRSPISLVGGAFVIFLLLCFGCGNPEAPQITKVRLSIWDSLTDPDNPGWVPLENGGDAPQSPVRVQGNITDNTAVVSPRITWIGERNDVSDAGFTECSNGTEEFFECKMECAGPTLEGYFECTPALDAQRLIRGDRFLFAGTQEGGETFEVEVSVSEAQKLTDNHEAVEVEYRILRVDSLEGNPGVPWLVYQRTDCGTWDRESAEDCSVDGPSSAWRALRSGDSLCWHPVVEEERGCTFQIALHEGEGEEGIDSVNATWSSLVKWNDDASLNWDATTGNFVEIFQIFDPRVREPNSGELIGEEGESTYRFVVSAQDVPDQKTEEYRSAEKEVYLTFSSGMAVLPPDLEVDGEDEELIEKSDPAQNIGGKVESFSGEVLSLLYKLSDGPERNRSRTYHFNPEAISLEGEFLATIVFVSDWDGDGVVDPRPEGEGITNFLEVTALDVQGNWTRTPVSIAFVPTTKKDKVPELQILKIFPAIETKGETLLPFGEQLRLRARAADDRGQPEFSAWECRCIADEPLINDYRCPCSLRVGGELNAGGEFPLDPWEWVVFEPPPEGRQDFAVLRATEKVEEEDDLPTAKFAAIQIDLEPESEEQAYQVSVSVVETTGPAVALTNLKQGDIVDPGELSIQATIFPHVSELNQITALWNQKPRGAPTYDSSKGVFLWDLSDQTVKEGDRICVGAISVTGHATMNLMEFADASEGLLVLGVTVTPDTEECGVPRP